jgi:spore maturation protein CgeB
VAPLLDTEFNDAKASQKWFESAAHSTAMVLQDSPVYECATHDENCLKAKDAGEFTRFMRLLIEDAELRRRIGEAARETVMSRHTVEQWSEHWRSAVGATRYSDTRMDEARISNVVRSAD